MWIDLVKVGEEFVVSGVLKSGGIVSHDVRRSWDIVGMVVVSVLSLVHARIVAQVG